MCVEGKIFGTKKSVSYRLWLVSQEKGVLVLAAVGGSCSGRGEGEDQFST